MKKFFVASLTLVLCVCAQAAKKTTPKLVLDASKGVAGSVTLPTGKKVNYTAYTKLYYVTHVEDSTYQYMNVFVPEGATQSTPIFMPNYMGGYMAAAPRMIDEGDASGLWQKAMLWSSLVPEEETLRLCRRVRLFIRVVLLRDCLI